MESRLVKLKSDFNNVITIRNSVKNIFDILQTRIDKLKLFYSEFVKNNRTEMFVFGLDSFNFQSKIIDIEYDDMKRLFLAINNRMYCEYFKLNKIIIEYILNNVHDKKILDITRANIYPIYKDLEPYKEYKFELVLEIHENILNLVSILIALLNNKENELSIHMTKKNIGLNIDNFITSFNFNITVMREKIIMFIAHIEFFHKLHTKYLKRFSNKIQLMYTHINNDINFDDSVEINKNKRNELIQELNIDNIDAHLLKDIKKSIGSESQGSESDNEFIIEDKNYTEDNKSNSSLSSILSLESITNRIRSGTLVSSQNSSPKIINENKRNLKEIFKKNVHKVSNILQLCKPNVEKSLKPNVSNKEIQNLFYNINTSCESIINNEINEFDIEEIQKEEENNITLEINLEEHKEAEKVEHIEAEKVEHKEAEKIEPKKDKKKKKKNKK